MSLHSRSGRWLVLLAFIASIVICNFYASVMLSTLVGTKYEPQVTTLEQLANSDIPVGIHNASYVRNFLEVLRKNSPQKITKLLALI